MIQNAPEVLKKLECEHPNAFPLGWREITPNEFARSQFMTYSSDFEDYRQMLPEKGEKRKEFLTYDHYRKTYLPQAMTARCYFYADGTGLAISTFYWNKTRPIRYFAFGCNHYYEELSYDESRDRGLYHAGNCYHVNECKKCKHINSYDSSD